VVDGRRLGSSGNGIEFKESNHTRGSDPPENKSGSGSAISLLYDGVNPIISAPEMAFALL